jgi:hypothetical protein
VAKELPPVAPVLEIMVKEMVGSRSNIDLDSREVEATVKDAVKEAVKEVVRDVVEDMVAQNRSEPSRAAQTK